MDSKLKGKFYMPDSQMCPLEKKSSDTVIHVAPTKILGKELSSELDTVHPLASDIATYKTVAKQDGKYSQSTVVDIGVKFLRWFTVFTVLSSIFILSTMLEEFGHWDYWSNLFSFVFINLLLIGVVYFELAFLEKISPSKFQFRILSKGFHLDILILLGVIVFLVAVFYSFLY